jgi:hypothetical protein
VRLGSLNYWLLEIGHTPFILSVSVLVREVGVGYWVEVVVLLVFSSLHHSPYSSKVQLVELVSFQSSSAKKRNSSTNTSF